MATRAGGVGLSAERHFFTGMAVAVLLSTFIGFAPSWYLRSIIPALHPYEPLTPLVIAHGLLFSAWVLLFAAQTGLVAAGRVDLHRRLGVAGIVLVALMMRPSLGRLPLPVPVVAVILPLLFLIPLIVWDVRAKGRVTPATLWGSIAVAVMTVAPGIVWNTPTWLAFAREVSRLAL